MMRLLAQAAAAQGIPLEFLLRRVMQGDGVEEEDEEVEYPFDSPPKSLQDVANFIQSDRCQSIVVLAGAGMSVASGIPGAYVRMVFAAVHRFYRPVGLRHTPHADFFLSFF